MHRPCVFKSTRQVDFFLKKKYSRDADAHILCSQFVQMILLYSEMFSNIKKCTSSEMFRNVEGEANQKGLVKEKRPK